MSLIQFIMNIFHIFPCYLSSIYLFAFAMTFYVVYLINLLFNGHGSYIFGYGFKYVGEWKDGMPHGQGIVTLPDGTKYVGEWQDSKQHGQGALVYPDGKVVKGIWKDNELVEVQ